MSEMNWSNLEDALARSSEKSKAEIAKEELEKMRANNQEIKERADLEAKANVLVEEINNLKAKAVTSEDWEEVIKRLDKLNKLCDIAEAREKGEVLPEDAREIMGDNFYGKEEIENAFGFEVKEEVPSIPYSVKELEKAKELEELLILRIKEDSHGNPMTIEKINEILKLKAIHSFEKYEEEPFYKEDSLETEWKLVSSSPVSNSINEDYFDQTIVLFNHLVMSNLIPKEESNKYFADMRRRELKALFLFNERYRRSPVEIIYDWVLIFKNKGTGGILEHCYDWSNEFSDGDKPISVSVTSTGEVHISRWRPEHGRNDYGVFSAR
ncbi:MAG: hypothetical protein WC319_03245 [Candidatus Paceibacterota bacterium]|jgi:hypothetical protein